MQFNSLIIHNILIFTNIIILFSSPPDGDANGLYKVSSLIILSNYILTTSRVTFFAQWFYGRRLRR